MKLQLGTFAKPYYLKSALLVSFVVFFSVIFALLFFFFHRSENLIFVQVVFRHGHRTPTSFYPKDPYNAETFLPFAIGDLTNIGKKWQYKLGQELRESYLDFLNNGTTIPNETVLGLSSQFNRTMKSLYWVLAGLLFPSQEIKDWIEESFWENPIDIHTTPISEDKLFLSSLCPKTNEAFEEYMTTSENKERRALFQETFSYIRNNTGLTTMNDFRVFELYGNLKSEEAFGLTLPTWTQEVFPEKLEAIVSDYYKARSGTKQLKKYTGGFLMKEILDKILHKKNGSSEGDVKLVLYSGHDMNVAYLLTILKPFDIISPNFGAYLVFELYKIGDEYSIKILHQNYDKEYPNPQIVLMPECGEFCPIDTFTNLVSDMLPNEGDLCGGPIVLPKN